MAGAVVNGAQVSFIGQDCEEIPEFIGRKYGHMAKRLDLSFNLLRIHASSAFKEHSKCILCTRFVSCSVLDALGRITNSG
ncbi:hypothetical protein Y1Q_0005189 [Alligator mississippiensis]|uniref:Uncharacterized protein n=1 Tax=Alligator mississippiensis TaxID=8496 RepID=A0A151MSY2_ALLMI|nr:hypothetical protein Y1Q_0005189 [Alligator mississippiensis]